ncbi:helix-turn-helix domain-containing protein [Robertmurraya sp. DFI.2.37]|uniref:helix-turn-helix domain-containing protein n=1 Tax=Robertmurraya sp. DFI.2.37 TaxID=3031819 RepID=UPI001246303A|nr:helix-turn-helix domain-containing protein [Robertmurraya sp. DFI.2.37]MDF1511174.1 helix-turn-helix domain-containing protein [Robertmurraya sp. DFI.2.37]
MISYEPLFKTIEEKETSLIEIENAVRLSSSVTAKFRKNQHVSLGTIEKICLYLNVPIEKVVAIKKK